MVTPAPLRGWDFSLGDSIRDEAWRCFGSPVHFSSHFSSSPFRLVVDVPRSTFRLTPSSVALYLRATIHGSPSGFQVQSLTDWSFSFVVMGWRRVVGARGEGSGRRGPLGEKGVGGGARSAAAHSSPPHVNSILPEQTPARTTPRFPPPRTCSSAPSSPRFHSLLQASAK
ncbi:hypothetical protein OsJ_06235 [Oryza sativa Japonica Group]|uniref:Uncharacterized protein n=1 Tax=Oryza sativa subsp. japonica TaxID=39947 RepID=A3A5I2_ORYSJ|nr:hypothetical protein OsJ_06235 [Oryza sativa Japonica Group]